MKPSFTGKPGRVGLLSLSVAGIFLLLVGITQIPSINNRLDWKIGNGMAYIRNLLNPAGSLPTALPQPQVSYSLAATQLPLPDTATTRSETPISSTSTPLPTSNVVLTYVVKTIEPTATPTSLPPSFFLTSPLYEKQDQNNCGPATLAIYLHYYGWTGDQYAISSLVKPLIKDKNVNVDELVYFVRTHVGWLGADYRVGGTISLLKEFIAAGFPIMIEESSLLDSKAWPDDDLWVGHYLLLTGYNDGNQTFNVQDSWKGANLQVSYATLDKHWQSYNRVYIAIYPTGQADQIKSIIGDDWDEKINRQHALDVAQLESKADPQNGFAWFNLGTNLVSFGRYGEAAQAYDLARKAGLPQRMLRYQFGPFMAYFYTKQIDNLITITDYALKITPDSEEDLLWRGWAYYLKNNLQDAILEFKKALEANPNYSDAKYALNFLGVN